MFRKKHILCIFPYKNIKTSSREGFEFNYNNVRPLENTFNFRVRKSFTFGKILFFFVQQKLSFKIIFLISQKLRCRLEVSKRHLTLHLTLSNLRQRSTSILATLQEECWRREVSAAPSSTPNWVLGRSSRPSCSGRRTRSRSRRSWSSIRRCKSGQSMIRRKRGWSTLFCRSCLWRKYGRRYLSTLFCQSYLFSRSWLPMIFFRRFENVSAFQVRRPCEVSLDRRWHNRRLWFRLGTMTILWVSIDDWNP